jgi:hypothetical protein
MGEAGEMKISIVATVSSVALLLALAGSACGSAATTGTASSAGRLLTYREEGGIGGPRPSLAVSTQGRATLRLGSCRVGYALGDPLWGKLRGALQRADLGSIVGDYPPPSGAADMITYVVRSDDGEVKIAPDPHYEAVLEQIEPLLGVLGKVVTKGRTRLPADCSGRSA